MSAFSDITHFEWNNNETEAGMILCYLAFAAMLAAIATVSFIGCEATTLFKRYIERDAAASLSFESAILNF